MTPADNQLRNRLFRGFGATAFGPIVTAIIQLGSVPVLLHLWGTAKYGDWLLLSALPSYLTLSDLGLGDTSASDMSMRVAAGDREGALQVFQSSWALVTGVSFVTLLLILASAWWLPWQLWLQLSTVSNLYAAKVMIALGAYVLVSQQNGIAESGYRSDGHFAVGTFWMTMLRLAEAVVATAVALLGGGLLAMAFTYLIIRCLGSIAYALLLRRLSPWIHYGIRHARLRTMKQMAAPAFGFMAFPIGYALSLQGFTIMIGARLGPAAVVAFSTLRTLSRLSLQAINVIKHALWPELSRAFGAANISLTRRLHRHACQASLLLSCFGGLLLWVWGPSIYRLWVREAVGFNALCFHILLFVGVANSLWETSVVIPLSINTHCRIALAYTGLMLFSLAIAWTLLPSVGTSGAAVALLAGDGLMATFVLRNSLSLVNDNPGRFALGLCELPRLRQIVPTTSDA